MKHYVFKTDTGRADASLTIGWNSKTRELSLEYENEEGYSFSKRKRNYSFRRFLKFIHKYDGTRNTLQRQYTPVFDL